MTPALERMAAPGKHIFWRSRSMSWFPETQRLEGAGRLGVEEPFAASIHAFPPLRWT
jgi:hypothetical protein